MGPKAKEIFDRIGTWPREDQEELADLARDIEARRTGLYEPTLEEEQAIREGIAELERGEGLNEDELRAFWKRYGVL